MTDRDLLQAYANSGDAESLGAFLGRYQQSLLRFVERLVGDYEAAQDVVQETFLQVARRPNRLLEVENCHNWLLRVARNLGVDRIRRDARARKHTEALKNRLGARTAESPSGALEAQEVHAAVRAAISRLSPRYREVLILKIQEEKSYREIAEITGLTVTNVGYLLHKAVKMLSSRLNDPRGLLE
jgi:RNA polymerase sigma-70 factor (ECF subfamily)